MAFLLAGKQKAWNHTRCCFRNCTLRVRLWSSRLFIATREPGKLMVMNSDEGKVIAELPAPGLVDDGVYDPQHKRIYVAGDQTLVVF